MKQVVMAIAAVISLGALVIVARAQDAAKVDPKHYTVAFENDQVRVLKIHYEAGEKSVMHSHPAAVAVFLSDAKGKFILPDGRTQDFNSKAGDVAWNDGGAHLPENTGDKAYDIVLVELKKK
jgi:quercetin dioxygenase-like cupin family protein